jgi:RimJ/RimL family protein N-acetyltransferase
MPELPFPDPPLRAGAVALRPWQREDVPAIVAACADPEISRLSPVIPFPYAESDAVAWLEMQEPLRQRGEHIDLAVVDAASGALLGAVGMGQVSWTFHSAEIGYWLARAARGYGHMSSAVRLLAGWAFDHLHFARLHLGTDPTNVASQRVAERCGFQREGHLRSNLVIRHSGERRDTLIYGLLPGELR